MQAILFSALVLSTATIIYQDFKTRLVSLWVLLLFGLVCISSVVYFRSYIDLLWSLLFTTLYLGFVGILLKLYLYVKFKKHKQIVNEQIGLADVLVIFFIGLTFNLTGLILFFCFSFIVTLLIFIVYTFLKTNDKEESVPLAGFLVFFYLSTIVLLNSSQHIELIDCSFYTHDYFTKLIS